MHKISQRHLITAKKHDISSGNLVTAKKHDASSQHIPSSPPPFSIKTSRKNITVYHKPHTLLQWNKWVHTQSHPHSSTPHLYRLYTTSSPPAQPPTEPSNHNSMSSRHVRSFSNIRIDLLDCIVVTFATSHLLRSLLKVVA
jgi:hypothetical protein